MKPNILWIMTDEQRPDSISAYDRRWARTPHIDRLAEEGVLFDSAYCPSPMCIPSRTSVLTGLYPHETGVWQNAENPQARTDLRDLVNSFAAAGYRTASFGKQHYELPERPFDTEEMIVLTDRVGYTDYASEYDAGAYGAVRFGGPTPWILGGAFPGTAEETSEAEVVRRGLKWLGEGDRSRPFFLRLSFNGPHTPVVPPKPWDEAIEPESLPEETRLEEGAPLWLQSLATEYAGLDRLPAGSLQTVRRSYYGYAAYLDHLVGTVVEALVAAGVIDETVVVYTSDHGTHLGDHGLVQKQTFYEQVATVPLIIRPPAGLARPSAKGTRLAAPIETRLVLPTLLTMCGLDRADAAGSDRDHSPRTSARNLAAQNRDSEPDNRRDGERAAEIAEAVLSGGEPTLKPVFSEYSLNPAVIRTHDRLAMARDGRWKLAVNLDAVDEGALYDLHQDPAEVDNLFHAAEHHRTRSRLEGLIATHVGSA